jgi:hypothetical protein
MPAGSLPGAPSAREIAEIAAMPDGARRNLWITWSYYRLNRAMVEITGQADLTWCGFAVWASKTAGTFIREEEAGPFIERWIAGATRRAGRMRTAVAKAIGIHHDHPAAPRTHHFSLRDFAAKICGDVGGAIAAGNQDVFGHIAPPFARLVELWQARGGALTENDRTQFLASLDDPSDPQAKYLRPAFEATLDAIATPDPRKRAQLMLQANALIGCAEQTRVQPFIAKSMTYPIRDLFHIHLFDHLALRFLRPLAALLHWLLRPFGHALQTEFDDLSTEWMMKLYVPGQALRLGENMPPLPDGSMYAKSLEALHTPQPEELLRQLNALDAAACAAKDWVSYTDRMRYIGVLFRSRQQEQVLWTPPFTDAQISELQAGRMPAGPL